MSALDMVLPPLTRQPTQTSMPSSVLVYGAGGMGRRMVQVLQAHGAAVEAVLDRGTPDGACAGIPVHRLDDWLSAHSARGRAVVVAVHNPSHSVADIARDLRVRGFGSVYTPIDVCEWLPGALPGSYWLDSPQVYAAHAEELAALHAMLNDDASRATLRAVLELRIHGNYGALGRPEPGQYFPASLPRWPQALRMIDCGAFDGDTLLAARAAGYGIEAALCFEPDPRNFDQLAVTARQVGADVSCLPCAVSRAAQQLRFRAEGTGSSHISVGGDMVAQALGLDQSFSAFRPNLIKMDIEGGEPDALSGAKELIQDCRPGLAISVYHEFSHLWSIPLMLRDWLPGHRFALRAHAYNSFDVVLYAQRHGK